MWNLANIEEGKYAPIRVGLGAEKAIAKHLMELLQLEGAQEDFDRYFENAAAIPGMPLTCHTDLTVLHKKVGRIYEIKTADALTFSRWQDSDGRLAIPTDVRIQLHHQTMVLEDVMTHLRGNVYAYAVVLFLPFGAVEMERELHQAVPGCKEGGEAAYINPDGKVAAFFTEFLAENSSLLKIIEAPPLAQEVRDSLLADYKDFAKAVQDNTPPPAESVKDISFLLPGVSGEVEATEQQRNSGGNTAT